MKLLALSDNALFVQTWKERMRPAMVWSAALITFIILGLILAGSFVNYGTYDHIPPTMESFWYIAIAQAFLLLLFGTNSAHTMATRERHGGTLDFHRSSPTSRIDQVFGLLLGAPSLEWCLFFATLPVSLVLAAVSNIGLGPAFNLFYALVLCAIFLHLVAIVGGLYPSAKPGTAAPRGGFIKWFIVLYLFSHLLFIPMMTGHMSFVYHSTCLPTFSHMYEFIFKPTHYGYREFDAALLNRFYGIELPTVIYQLIVELPLTVLLFIAAMRKISRPERPLWSKSQTLGGIAFILFLFIGSAISVLLPGDNHVVPGYAVGFLYLSLFLALAGVFSITPSQLLFLKGLRKRKKLGPSAVQSHDDHSSNTLWTIVACMIVIVAYLILRPWIADFYHHRLSPLLATLLYIVVFAGALEYFRLSRFHNKRGYFAVAILVLWLFLPILGWILDPVTKSFPYLSAWFHAPSPFIGLGILISQFEPYKNIDVFKQTVIGVILGVNLALAVLTSALAFKERQRLRREVFPENSPK